MCGGSGGGLVPGAGGFAAGDVWGGRPGWPHYSVAGSGDRGGVLGGFRSSLGGGPWARLRGWPGGGAGGGGGYARGGARRQGTWNEGRHLRNKGTI
jgi:hypothetical protein